MNKKKTIIFLGTNYLQLDAIKIAKRLNFFVFGFDKQKNSPGKNLCDKFYNIDCLRVDLISKILLSKKKYSYKTIWANNDIIIESRCKLEQLLKIEHARSSLAICKNFLDKKKFKTKFNSKLIILNTHTKFPKIGKPSIGSGSAGVKLFKNKYEINEKENLILEDYVNGTEFGLNYFNTKKNFFILPVVKRYFDHKKSFVPLGTSTYFGGKVNLFHNFFKKFLKDKKIYGPIKVDVIVNNTQKKIIELSNRFHGEIDTTHVFNYINFPLCKIFFKYLINSEIPEKLNKNDYIGYFSVFKKKIENQKINRIFNKYNLLYLKTIHKKDSIYQQIPSSTNNIMIYIFFKSNKEINKKNFYNISTELNE
jgi:hypothetical protein